MKGLDRGALFLAVGLLIAAPAIAYPDGAPWGSTDPESPQSCASCHFDGEAVMDSAAVKLSFSKPLSQVKAGETEKIYLVFDGESKVAGFQLSASAGQFIDSGELLESRGGEVRSIQPFLGEGKPIWAVQWRAPAEPVDNVEFHAAVNAADGDGSPFGDVIHFKTIYAYEEE